MYYDHMVLSTGKVIFPVHLDKTARQTLKNRMAEENITMYCGCSAFSEKRLEYGISADGKIFPLHQNYEHSPNCTRGNITGRRKVAYQASEDGTAKAYLNFDITKCPTPVVKVEKSKEEACIDADAIEPEEKEESAADQKEPEKKEKKEKLEKEPFNSLSQFVLQLNTDTYKERVMAGKGLISADYFLPAVQSRLKNVYVDGVKKPLRELTLEKDALSFFYQPLISVEIGERKQITLKGWKSNYSIFVFEATLLRERELFEKRYGITVEEALGKYRVMAAGFIYLRLSRQETIYKVVGRLHIFIVNENGLYCRDLDEVDELNAVSEYIRQNYRYKTTQFHRVIDDERIFGIIAREGKKQILICKPKVPKSIAVFGENHIALGTELLTDEDLRQIDEIGM